LSLAVPKLKIDQELPEDRSVGPTNRHAHTDYNYYFDFSCMFQKGRELHHYFLYSTL